MPTNRNFPDHLPPWEDRDPSPMHGPPSTDGGSVETPATAGEQPMREIDGEDLRSRLFFCADD